MNAKFLYIATVAIALVSSTAAMATEATQFDGAASTGSRADVKAKLTVARAQGQLTERGESYGGLPATVFATSTRTRAEVLAEAARANRDPHVPAEAYGYFEPSLTSVRSRDEVRAEARSQTLSQRSTR